jgi:hypothetical protein
MSATLVRPPVDDLRTLPHAVPNRTTAQRFEALERANRIRSDRKLLKREIKAGRVTLFDLLSDPPEYLLSAKVYDFVLACPRAGRSKADQAFKRAGVSPSKTFGGITEHQVGGLLSRLAEFPSLRVLGARRRTG